MGAGASISNLPNELLLDGQLQTRNGLPHNMPPLVVSKDALQGLRRKSFSEARRKSGARRASKQLLPVYEIPGTVLNLLNKVGISVGCSDIDGDACEESNHLSRNSAVLSPNKTTKLVAHIFECLGALQHLVRADQGQAILSSRPDEMEAEMERSSASLGQLVHEMVTIYSLCGDTMKVILDNNPEAAGIEDSYGRLPLHAAVDSQKPWIGSIIHMIDAYPEALSLKDGAGRLPLHIAVDQETPDIHLIQLLVNRNRAAAAVTRGVGRLPIHYAVFPENVSYDILDCLIRAYPEGCRAHDVYGRLPLHYAVDKPSESNVQVIQRLLEEYPEGANKCDSHNQTPLMIAVARSGKNKMSTHIVEVLMQYTTVSDDTDTDTDNGCTASCAAGCNFQKSLLGIAMEVAVANVDCIRLLARKYPEMILKPSNSESDAHHTNTCFEQHLVVDLSKRPDLSYFLGVPDYFSTRRQSQQYQNGSLSQLIGVCMAFSPKFAATSPLYVAMTRGSGWSDATRVQLQFCSPRTVVMVAESVPSSTTSSPLSVEGKENEREEHKHGGVHVTECVTASALLREMNWRARKIGLLISIKGQIETDVGMQVDIDTVLTESILSVAAVSAQPTASDDVKPMVSSPRISLCAIPENNQCGPQLTRLSGVNLVLVSRDRAGGICRSGNDHDDTGNIDADISMSVDDFDDDHDSLNDESIDLSVKSFRPRPQLQLGTTSMHQNSGRAGQKHNLFRKLYVTNSDVWRQVIAFL